MTPPGHESETLRDLLEGDLEDEVVYESDAIFMGPDGSPLTTLTCEDDSCRAPNPFPKRDAADTLTALRTSSDVKSTTLVTNPLDEHQRLTIAKEDSAQRRSRSKATLQDQRDYVFKPLSVEDRLKEASRGTLRGWTIGPEATTPDDIAKRTALRERYLTPLRTTQSLYKARLAKQARGAPVPTLKGIPILLFANETESEEDNDFIHWVHRVRRLSSMWALRASASAADVRLERKLRYEYAKLKARGQVRSTRSRYAQHLSASATPVAASPHQDLDVDSSVPTITGGKRSGSQVDPDRGVRKCQPRTGNPADEVSQIPTSYMTQDTHATLPDTGFDRGDDASGEASPHGTKGSLAHRAAPVEAGVSAKAHAELVHEVKCLRETLAQTQSTLETMQTKLQVLEQHRLRTEGQLNILVRMVQPSAQPTSSAQAPPHSRGSNPDTA